VGKSEKLIFRDVLGFRFWHLQADPARSAIGGEFDLSRRAREVPDWHKADIWASYSVGHEAAIPLISIKR